MTFPYQFVKLADKEELLTAYKGKKVDELPTPGFVVSLQKVKDNCRSMFQSVASLGFDFRPHVKTHKTIEATLLELGQGTEFHTDRIVVSTLIEAWNLLPLCKKGLINDILCSMPVEQSRLGELAKLSESVKHLRIMVDNYEQIGSLVKYNREHKPLKKWSVFIKINMGSDRAGFVLESSALRKTIEAITHGNESNDVELFGFYCHAGHSYGCHSVEEAKNILIDEINSVNAACKIAKKIDSSISDDLILSIGATPTAHVIDSFDEKLLDDKLLGKVELHAGNYAFCDLQQVGTNCCRYEDVACRVLGEVVSSYPGRGSVKPGEGLVNVGVLGIGRETGAVPGFGHVGCPEKYRNWILGRISQEHGVLTVLDCEKQTELIPIGTRVLIYPQHTCIAAACYPWYYVVDGNGEITNENHVIDIWVPTRGW